jgi:hypothetical protein
MPQKPPHLDPGGAYRRGVVAARRVAFGQCACGESRPEALIGGTNPVQCEACKRTRRGAKPVDQHHFAGRSNDPFTIAVPINDHRAFLTPAQRCWPRLTLRNHLGSPLLAAAARIRGFVDVVHYLIENKLLWIAEMLESLDVLLAKKLGPRWWVSSEIEQFAPKGKVNGPS